MVLTAFDWSILNATSTTRRGTEQTCGSNPRRAEIWHLTRPCPTPPWSWAHRAASWEKTVFRHFMYPWDLAAELKGVKGTSRSCLERKERASRMRPGTL